VILLCERKGAVPKAATIICITKGLEWRFRVLFGDLRDLCDNCGSFMLTQRHGARVAIIMQ
jgi:hypothetical protein